MSLRFFRRNNVHRALAFGLALHVSPAQADFDADFARATDALRDGRAAVAINELEALADRGLLDANASYNRGLAYLTRVRSGGEEAGDLGRAAHAFEEARELGDNAVAADAETALTAIRGEIARRRARAGLRSPVNERPPLGDTIVHTLPTRVPAILALLSSVLVALALLGRLARTSSERIRAGTSATLLFALPTLVLGTTLAYLTARDRRLREEFVIVTSNTYPTDERGVPIPGLDPMPEGGRVRQVRAETERIEIDWQGHRVFLPRSALRRLALKKS